MSELYNGFVSAWKNVEDRHDKYVCNSEEAESAADEE